MNEPVVFLKIRSGLLTVVGGTLGVRVVILDYDTHDPHPSYSAEIIENELTLEEVINIVEFTQSLKDEGRD